jgi:hypothetical protein
MIKNILFIPSSGSSTLLNNLLAYWKLDETSGTRIDSHGSNNLIDNNTVGSATGKIGNAASFVAANSEYLSVNSSQLSFAGDFTISVWNKPTSVVGTSASYVLSKDDTTNREYHIQLLSSNYNFQVWNGATKYLMSLPATSGVWQHLMMWYDSVAGTLYASVNNGTPATGAVPGINTTSAPFLVGVRGDFKGYYDGLIDEVGIWTRLLTTAERTQLYNSGSGLTYPF